MTEQEQHIRKCKLVAIIEHLNSYAPPEPATELDLIALVERAAVHARKEIERRGEQIDALHATLTAKEAAGQWTAALPTVVGFYWYRPHWNRAEPDRATIVKVVRGGDDLFVEHFGARSAGLNVKTESGEWMGPLEANHD